MTHGQVDGLQAEIDVVFRVPDSPNVKIKFAVDTGFVGAMTLSPEAVAALNLPFFEPMEANLADCTSIVVNVHVASIIWEGREIDVLVLAMGRRPLLGTALLAGKELVVQFVDRGLVTVDDV
jgi:clan AA aspartic protease